MCRLIHKIKIYKYTFSTAPWPVWSWNTKTMLLKCWHIPQNCCIMAKHWYESSKVGRCCHDLKGIFRLSIHLRPTFMSSDCETVTWQHVAKGENGKLYAEKPPENPPEQNPEPFYCGARPNRFTTFTQLLLKLSWPLAFITDKCSQCAVPKLSIK